jgi:hypothetical protein
MGRPSSRDALAGAALVLALGTGCELINQPTHDGLVVRTAEVVGDTVRIAFSVDVPQTRWSWYVDLDTDQALDASGKKTGYGAFGIEYAIDSRDELGDSVAVRPRADPSTPPRVREGGRSRWATRSASPPSGSRSASRPRCSPTTGSSRSG